jgi:hypothetical protein
MATKTTTKLSDLENATQTLYHLETKATELAATRASDERELEAISFEAHGSGDQKALARLETIKARAVKRELDAKSLDAAIAEAKRRVVDAQNAEAMAEAARVADEVAGIAEIIREEGKKADKALAQFTAAANNVKKCIMGLQQRGLGSPNSAQLQALGRRAILGALVDSPFAKEFEHVAPRQQNFAQFTSSWATAIENAVGAKTKKEAADERAA